MKRKLRIILSGLLLVIAVGVIAFFVYVANYYEADDIAKYLLLQENIETRDNVTHLKPKEYSGHGIIFYPGALVEYSAYLPLLYQLSLEGYHVFLVEMPFNLAFFDYNKARDIIDSNANVSSWTIAGHSLGGAMASQFASENTEDIKQLILLGAYPYKPFPSEQTLIIAGSEDLLVLDDISEEMQVVWIEGGNHAQFGNYGIQAGDGEATIDHTQQQNLTIEEIIRFIR